MLSNWLKKFMPLCYQSKTLKPKPVITHMHSNTFCQLAVFALSVMWFTGLSVIFMISQSFNFVLVLQHSVEKDFILEFKDFITVGPCWPLSPGSPAMPLLPFIPAWPGSP